MAILRAWQKGPSSTAGPIISTSAWWSAFEEVGLDPHFYAAARGRERGLSVDHINTGVKKRWLLADYQASRRGGIRADCREECDACGVGATFRKLRVETPAEAWHCPPVTRRGS